MSELKNISIYFGLSTFDIETFTFVIETVLLSTHNMCFG